MITYIGPENSINRDYIKPKGGARSYSGHSGHRPTTRRCETERTCPKTQDVTQRVQVLNNLVLGFWIIVIIVQVLGKHMIIRYLDP